MSESSYKLHQCQYISERSIDIIYSENSNSHFKNAWTLMVRREATESDLEEYHTLEDVGDTMWETSIEILCCPFCGEKLEGGRSFEGMTTFYDGLSY